MKILMLEWDSFGQEYVIEEFKNADYSVDIFPWPFGREDMRENDSLCQRLAEMLETKEYRFVFSFNFFPVAAWVCNQHSVKYASWIYDTPYMLLYSRHTMLDTNYIFFFAKALFYEFKKYGVKNVFYLPLAAPVNYYDNLNAEEGKRYSADISFVGSTYNEARQDFFQYIDKVDEYTSGYLQAIMKMQSELYGNFILEELLTDNILRELQKVCPIKKGEDEWETDAWVYANYFLARKMTGEQRVEQLEMLGENHQVKLYAPEQEEDIKNVINCGMVDYVKEMPLVFKNTKINLNMTLRSIHTGIPLRAMDIMGCGGFLLTNYQQDFLEYFEPGVDYIYYASKKDMLYLVDYYLNHEEERMEIARNGYRKVKKGHTYKDRIEQLLMQMNRQ
ncbi:MAG: glycosyltransferase [Kineothrix sp.]|nr:glycosyltransferase [Kineothrix sp.]